MIDLVIKRMPRSFPFHAFNACVALTIVFFIGAPILSHFADRSESISESMADLAHVQSIKRTEKTLMESALSGDPFLAGSEERVVSADLQANLKAVASNSGVKFLGIRGLPVVRLQQLRMVAVALDIEGSVHSVENVIRSIERQTPYLFVTSAVLRRGTDAEEVIRAELKVQGAIRDPGAGSGMPPSDAQSHSAEHNGE
jgi:general secretion pathway protein M